LNIRIGGIQKTSLIDYPPHLSCVLFLSGCNFRCPYCHNPQLVERDIGKTSEWGEGWVLDFLKKRQQWLEGVVLSGGEPTLQPSLINLCKKIKQLGYLIKLDTNGSRPELLKILIHKRLVDTIAMDIKADPANYPAEIIASCDPRSIMASIRIIMETAPDYEFRTTCVKPIVNEDIIEGIARRIRSARSYALQPFIHTDILDAGFLTAQGSQFDEDDLKRFQGIAQRWVKTCHIRGRQRG